MSFQFVCSGTANVINCSHARLWIILRVVCDIAWFSSLAKALNLGVLPMIVHQLHIVAVIAFICNVVWYF